MAVTQDRPAPYAPASAILSLIEKYRNRGLPSPIDGGVLERAGVSPSLIPRTLQALQTFDLIGEDGRPTEVLEGIRLAPEAEYKKRLADWLTDVYADALAFIDPATATDTEIRDAFRKYVPVGQQDRMVSLFTGLFTAAGVMPPRESKPAPRKSGTQATRPTVTPMTRRKADPAVVRRHYGGGDSGSQQSQLPSGIPPALAGLLQSLPASGQGWPKERRDAFLATFGAVIDFCFPVRPEEPQAPASDEIDDLIGIPRQANGG
jgi:hypothetical protein